MSNLLFRKESDMEDSEGLGGVSSGQALLRDHLQSSGIEGGDWRVFGGAARAHGIDTFGGKCGNSKEGGGTPCFSGGTRRRTCQREGDVGPASRSPMSNLLFRKESDMGDARGWGGVLSGQALLRDHLQSYDTPCPCSVKSSIHHAILPFLSPLVSSILFSWLIDALYTFETIHSVRQKAGELSR